MRRCLLVLLVVLGLVAAACGNSADDDQGADETSEDTRSTGELPPGVTADTIRVGGIASESNPLGGKYADAFAGAKLYFDRVNADGGVFGKRIDVVGEYDDRIDGSLNKSYARRLVERDKVFAVIPIASLFFGGADYLADHDIPTFGWNINTEWSKGPSLFGEKGSFLCIRCGGPYLSWLAHEAGRSKAAILAYNVDQSRDCATGSERGYEKYGKANGVELAFSDASLAFGFPPGALAPDIDRIRREGVDLVSTCMDGEASAKVGRALRDAGLEAVQFLPNGYNAELIEEFGDVLEGSYVAVQFVPIEEPDPPEGLQQFLDAMEQAGKKPNENALAGWINADLFVTGLRAAGEHFTRASLVDAINAMDNYTAGGILAGIDWRKAHTQSNTSGCTAALQVQGGKLVPVFGQPGKPFVCFDPDNPDFDDPVIR
jgi:branched-chain amino acid transport system substrate-binding protein